MSIVRFNPWRDLDHLVARMGDAAAGTRAAGWVPPADVWETPSDYRIEIEIPAVSAEEVEIRLEEGVLTVEGERKRSEPEGDDCVRHRAERRYGRFARSFRLPEQADDNAISASARDGVLAVVIAKRPENQRRRIEIQAA